MMSQVGLGITLAQRPEPVDTFELIKEFEVAFEVPMASEPTAYPMVGYVRDRLRRFALELREVSKLAHIIAANYDPDKGGTAAMRVHLMVEELAEVIEAMCGDSLPHLLKELNDQEVVNRGTALIAGLGGELFLEGMILTHLANMSKLVDGKPLKDAAGRVLKGPNYKKADLSPLFERFARGRKEEK